MQEGNFVMTPARKLLLATCIASAALLSGCSDSDAPKEKPAAAQAEPEKGTAQRIIDDVNNAREAELAARRKAQEDAQAAAEQRKADEAAALKVTKLPDPGKAPEGTKFIDLSEQNEAVWLYQAKTETPDTPEEMAKSLYTHYIKDDKEYVSVLEDYKAADRFRQREGAAKLADVLKARVEQRKDATYVKIAVSSGPGLNMLKPYDFDKSGFAVDADTLFSNDENRAWLEVAPNYRVLFANGKDMFFPVADETLARTLEARVQKGGLSYLTLMVYGHLNAAISSPEDANKHKQAWRGLEVTAQRVDLVDSNDTSKVYGSIEL